MRYALETTAAPASLAGASRADVTDDWRLAARAHGAGDQRALGPLPFFEKARWLDVIPEYNPFKYNSFPANAANQSYRVSSLLPGGGRRREPKRPADRLPRS